MEILADNILQQSLKCNFVAECLSIKYTLHKPLIQYSWNKFRHIKNNNLLNIIDTYEKFLYFVKYHPDLEHLYKFLHNSQPIINKTFIMSKLDCIFVPIAIIDWILENCQHQYKFKLSINQRHVINYTIFSADLLSNTIQNVFITKTLQCIQIIFGTYNVKSNDEININFFMTPFKKFINPINKKYTNIDKLFRDHVNGKYNTNKIHSVISVDHVNSGFCNLQHNNNFISIWRQEEYPKVLLHELIHLFRLEKIKVPDLVDHFRLNVSHCSISSPIELITELQTWYLYLLYCKIVNNLTKTQLIRLAIQEQNYTITKIAHILQYNDIQNINLFWNNDNPKYTVNFNCSLVYYYILKAIAIGILNRPVLELIVPGQHLAPNVDDFVNSINGNYDLLKPIINQLIKRDFIMPCGLTMMQPVD